MWRILFANLWIPSCSGIQENQSWTRTSKYRANFLAFLLYQSKGSQHGEPESKLRGWTQVIILWWHNFTMALPPGNIVLKANAPNWKFFPSISEIRKMILWYYLKNLFNTSNNRGKYWMAGQPSINFCLIEEIPVPLTTRMSKPIFYCLKKTIITELECKYLPYLHRNYSHIVLLSRWGRVKFLCLFINL